MKGDAGTEVTPVGRPVIETEIDWLNPDSMTEIFTVPLCPWLSDRFLGPTLMEKLGGFEVPEEPELPPQAEKPRASKRQAMSPIALFKRLGIQNRPPNDSSPLTIESTGHHYRFYRPKSLVLLEPRVNSLA